MNPLTVLPVQVRQAVYAVVFLAGLVLAAWQAAEGDWVAFGVLLTGSLTGALAGSNVDKGHGDGDEHDADLDELDGE